VSSFSHPPAIVALAAAAVAVWVRPPAEGIAGKPSGGYLATLLMPRVLLVWGSFVCLTFTFGGAVSFSPLLLPGTAFGAAPTFLLVVGLARTATRTLSGRVIDRLGDWRPVWPVLLLGALGLAVLPLRQPALTVLAAVLFGTGLGVTQTSTFIGMIRSTDPSRAGIVSGLWNMGVDVGVATSALVLAPLGAAIGYQAMFWTLPALFLAALAARSAENFLPRPRPA
jgi:predicted MFS family arabinose efflux permease